MKVKANLKIEGVCSFVMAEKTTSNKQKWSYGVTLGFSIGLAFVSAIFAVF